jgi:phage tail protein X
MSDYLSRQGDCVDYICWKHYGTERGGTVEAVLEANPGIGDFGPILPAGVKITLPELSQPAQAEAVINLWE